MKRIIKRMLFTLSILFLLTFVSNCITSSNMSIGMLSHKTIGKYIIRNTPVGSSRNDVRTFIEEKGYEIEWDEDYPHQLGGGVTVPKQSPPIGNYYRPENARGAKNIRALIAYVDEIICIECTWVFDEDEKLLFVEIYKDLNLP